MKQRNKKRKIYTWQGTYNIFETPSHVNIVHAQVLQLILLSVLLLYKPRIFINLRTQNHPSVIAHGGTMVPNIRPAEIVH